MQDIAMQGGSGVKGTFIGESAHVKFIDNIIRERQTRPVAVFPREIRVGYLGWAMNSLRLKPRGGVRAFFVAIQPVKVLAFWLNALNNGLMVTPDIFY